MPLTPELKKYYMKTNGVAPIVLHPALHHVLLLRPVLLRLFPAVPLANPALSLTIVKDIPTLVRDSPTVIQLARPWRMPLLMMQNFLLMAQLLSAQSVNIKKFEEPSKLLVNVLIND